MPYITPFKNDQANGAARQMARIVQVDGASNPDGSTLSTPLIANGGLTWLDVLGVNGAITYTIYKSGAGTCNAYLLGTLDTAQEASSNSVTDNVRFYIIGTGGTLTAVAGPGSITLGASTQHATIAVLDAYASLQVALDTVSGSVSVTSRALLVPQ